MSLPYVGIILLSKLIKMRVYKEAANWFLFSFLHTLLTLPHHTSSQHTITASFHLISQHTFTATSSKSIATCSSWKDVEHEFDLKSLHIVPASREGALQQLKSTTDSLTEECERRRVDHLSYLPSAFNFARLQSNSKSRLALVTSIPKAHMSPSLGESSSLSP